MRNIEGGREVVERLKKAYGFTKQIDLAKHLDMAQSTFATWVSRKYFPAELVVRCHLETGARMEYLAYGEEPIFSEISDMKFFHRVKLESGKLFELPHTAFMLPHLPPDVDPETTLCVVEGNFTYFVATKYEHLVDGEYMVVIENSKLMRYLTVLPAGRVRLTGGKFEFDADIKDIEIVGKVILKMERM